LKISLAIAVVAVMSVQPTSENLTVLQLSGSPAKTMLELASAIALDSVRTAKSFIVLSPLIRAVDLRTEPSLEESIGGRRSAVKSNNFNKPARVPNRLSFRP
jgi:hypothetical protein